MKLSSEPIIAITTRINGKKVYVEHTTLRPDNRRVPFFTTDINLAKDLVSEAAAKAYIKSFINHHGREFTIEPAMAIANTKKYLHSKPLSNEKNNNLR